MAVRASPPSLSFPTTATYFVPISSRTAEWGDGFPSRTQSAELRIDRGVFHRRRRIRPYCFCLGDFYNRGSHVVRAVLAIRFSDHQPGTSSIMMIESPYEPFPHDGQPRCQKVAIPSCSREFPRPSRKTRSGAVTRSQRFPSTLSEDSWKPSWPIASHPKDGSSANAFVLHSPVLVGIAVDRDL